MTTTALARTTGGVRLQSMDDMVRFAKVAVESGHFKGSGIADAIMRIQAGAEIGLAPYAALRGIHFVNGKPGLDYTIVGAAIKQSGRYDYRVVEQTNDRCELEWTERGKVLGSSYFTIEEAKTANLSGKDVWRNYPRTMLFARALTQGARTFCPDVFQGSVYTAEELETQTATAEVVGGPETAEGPATAVEDAGFEEPPKDEAPKQTQGEARTDATLRIRAACKIDDAAAVSDLLHAIPPGLPADEQAMFKLARNAVGLMIAGEIPSDVYNAIGNEENRDRTLRVWARCRSTWPELDEYEDQVANDIDKRLEDEGRAMSGGA